MVTLRRWSHNLRRARPSGLILKGAKQPQHLDCWRIGGYSNPGNQARRLCPSVFSVSRSWSFKKRIRNRKIHQERQPTIFYFVTGKWEVCACPRRGNSESHTVTVHSEDRQVLLDDNDSPLTAQFLCPAQSYECHSGERVQKEKGSSTKICLLATY